MYAQSQPFPFAQADGDTDDPGHSDAHAESNAHRDSDPRAVCDS
jgi:hypothetical protein